MESLLVNAATAWRAMDGADGALQPLPEDEQIHTVLLQLSEAVARRRQRILVRLSAEQTALRQLNVRMHGRRTSADEAPGGPLRLQLVACTNATGNALLEMDRLTAKLGAMQADIRRAEAILESDSVAGGDSDAELPLVVQVEHARDKLLQLQLLLTERADSVRAVCREIDEMLTALGIIDDTEAPGGLDAETITVLASIRGRNANELLPDDLLTLRWLQRLTGARQTVETLRTDRLTQIGVLCRKIKTLRGLLELPDPDHCNSAGDLSQTVIDTLHAEYVYLCECWQLVKQERLEKLLGQLEQRISLYRLSDRCRQEIMTSIGDSDDAGYFERVLEYIGRLDEMFADAVELIGLVRDREAFIQKMTEFEKSASDPRRLFKSSFQLNEEERFRKTSYPTLLQMEQTLRDRITAWEQEKQKRFYCGDLLITSSSVRPQVAERQPYLLVLDREIGNRFVNTGIFEFFNAGDASSTKTKGTFKSPRAPLAKPVQKSNSNNTVVVGNRRRSAPLAKTAHSVPSLSMASPRGRERIVAVKENVAPKC